MDETNARLREAADQCLKAYDAWQNNKKDIDARGNLADAVHDLRKVASRVEIEVAMSERDEMVQRPLPVPPHRSMRPRQGGDDQQGGGYNTAEPENAGPRPDRGDNIRRRMGPRTPRPERPATPDNSEN